MFTENKARCRKFSNSRVGISFILAPKLAAYSQKVGSSRITFENFYRSGAAIHKHLVDDVVYVHVAAEGSKDGRMARKEFVRGYRPIDVAGKSRTAIAWTTAGSVVAIIEMVRDGKLPASGFLKQEDISLSDFLATPTGGLYAQ